VRPPPKTISTNPARVLIAIISAQRVNLKITIELGRTTPMTANALAIAPAAVANGVGDIALFEITISTAESSKDTKSTNIVSALAHDLTVAKFQS